MLHYIFCHSSSESINAFAMALMPWSRAQDKRNQTPRKMHSQRLTHSPSLAQLSEAKNTHVQEKKEPLLPPRNNVYRLPTNCVRRVEYHFGLIDGELKVKFAAAFVDSTNSQPTIHRPFSLSIY